MVSVTGFACLLLILADRGLDFMNDSSRLKAMEPVASPDSPDVHSCMITILSNQTEPGAGKQCIVPSYFTDIRHC